MKELTPQVKQRLEKSNMIVAEYREKGYRDRTLTMGVVKANTWALVSMVPLAVLMFFIFKIMGNVIYVSRENGIFLILGFCAEVVLHELIHGATWGLLTGNHFKDISFGIIWKMLTPYCYCSTPMKKSSYIVGGFMPTLFLGLIQFIAALLLGSTELLWLSCCIGVVGGGADMVMIVKILTSGIDSKKSLIIDHPTTIGCIILEKPE